MNNKGQTLVIFVVLLPLFILLLGVVIDSGFIYISKRNIENSIKDSLTIKLDDTLTDSEVESAVKELLNKNIKKINQLTVNTSSGFISVKLEKYIDTPFSKYFKRDYYNVSIKYTGTVNGNKLKIKKD